jgi:N-acetylmuramoyl-L-alanine amidase
MKLMASIAVSVPLLLAQSGRGPIQSVTAIRHWTVGDVTRVAVEVTGEFETRSDRLHNPERIYFDILNARPRFGERRLFSEEVNGKLLKRVRAAETAPGVTRVVLELEDAVEANPSQLANPNRLMIELRPGTPPAIPPITAAPPPDPAPVVSAALPSPKPAVKPKPSAAPVEAPEPVAAAPIPIPAAPEARVEIAKVEARVETPKADAVVKPADTPAPGLGSAGVSPGASLGETAKSAHRTSDGQNSLIRALGLKINRVVIDPGHGGHDQGTTGPKGLLEKDLVLDVALRLGKLIGERMGAEVIYTRSDDTFVPLEGRTALANDKKADLFLSIHANSSPAPHVTGIETYYLNLTDAKDALDVASRENASSQKSVFELRDLIQKITLNDKVEESREFAGRVQASLFALSLRNFPTEKNRGVRKAPFVVLVGANMPSVLAEIGFLSNPKEESLLSKPDYRQKLAEALFRGVSRYADGLSHFQMALN